MLVTQAGLYCQYYDDIATAKRADHQLALFVFDASCRVVPEDNVLSTGLLPLDGCIKGELLAVNHQHIERGYTANTYWAETEECLLLALWSDEVEDGSLVAATTRLYEELLQQIRTRGYPHLVRVWNYFADINGEEQGLERYRQFCLGRFNAFAAAGIDENQFPSACALGHGGGDLLVYAIASKTVPQHFENPRQASAYHYPTEYGPRSPSFARASLLNLADQIPKLFVSGTASVVGYVTQHPDDLAAQITVTFANLDYLLAHVAQRVAGDRKGAVPTLQAEVLKVYVRHAADLDEIKRRVQQAYPQIPVVYVAADICRSDLLLEIDGIWNLLP